MLASGVGNVFVKFGAKSEERGVMGRGGQDDGVGMDNSTSEHRTKDGEWKSNSVVVDREEGAMRKVRAMNNSWTEKEKGMGDFLPCPEWTSLLDSLSVFLLNQVQRNRHKHT